MSPSTLQLDDQLSALLRQTNLPVEQAAREMIVMELYRRRMVSSGKAAEMLNTGRVEFIGRASQLGIPFFDMTPEELKDDLERLRNP